MRKGSNFPGDVVVVFMRFIARNKFETLGLFIGERFNARFAYIT
jgi:hypothetical protein